MKRENIAIIMAIIVALAVDILMFMHFNKKEESVTDENQLYIQVFDDIYLRFERYDYALGQNMLVGVEKSLDGGKTYKQVSKDYALVSIDSDFCFLNVDQGFIISKKMLSRQNNFAGLKVSNNGGVTFMDAKFEYENTNVDVLNIIGFPYIQDDKLKLECIVYEPYEDGYHEITLTFISDDEGLNWHL